MSSWNCPLEHDGQKEHVEICCRCKHSQLHIPNNSAPLPDTKHDLRSMVSRADGRPHGGRPSSWYSGCLLINATPARPTIYIPPKFDSLASNAISMADNCQLNSNTCHLATRAFSIGGLAHLKCSDRAARSRNGPRRMYCLLCSQTSFLPVPASQSGLTIADAIASLEAAS